MRKFKTVYMRGGTSKGCMFLREDLPADRKEWDEIFLQVMGNPDPKQMDGMGGTVSSNNKIVIVWKSAEKDVDVEYLVGQVIVGKKQVDYKSNCGNMTAAVAPFAVEEGLVPVVEPITTVRMLNKNTDKYINVTVPIDPETHTFAQDGDCHIAGIDGTAAELKVNFLNPAGAKTGKLLPTGSTLDVLDIEGRKFEATILDVSNPLVLVKAEDVGLTGTEMPAVVDANKEASALLEKIRGAAAVKMGFAKDLADATANSPAVPKVGVFTAPVGYTDIAGQPVEASAMDLCVRVISVFKCHKACPLTAASSIAVAAFLPGSIIEKTLGALPEGTKSVRLGHPSGVMTVYPDLEEQNGEILVHGVAVQRTARRTMDGFVYIRK
ncbi:PrpF protein [Acidaminococcus sp. NSJ-142]|jgi:2-methylaconitate cis-trans-isomerase PrpF|uniref:2-methylaconitate cis-trans isomerase PrpF family protein n=1 Tax=Acidaminococcus TaxID=904 RepID=UPI000CFA6661|nr:MULTISPECIES: PrpF domain-containing protein [Acidaminococcus]MCD2435919.1 PrpF protein [Acidaminococcus hominis]RHK02577.1 PrpF protein [Acidaminococcus sp. AM05-11]